MATKYSYELKKHLVSILEKKEMSATALSKKYNIHKGIICKLHNRYKVIGDAALQSTHTRNNYSSDFKLEVLRYRVENNLSYESTALHFNIPSVSVICDWNKSYEALLLDNDMAKKNKDNVNRRLSNEEVQELEHLRKVVKYQAAEIAYLKKLEALIQSRQEKKIKHK